MKTKILLFAILFVSLIQPGISKAGSCSCDPREGGDYYELTMYSDGESSTLGFYPNIEACGIALLNWSGCF